MVKTLVKHGNSYALVIDKTLMELAGIGPDSQLSVQANGQSLTITPVGPDVSQEEFAASLAKVNRQYHKALKRLGE